MAHQVAATARRAGWRTELATTATRKDIQALRAIAVSLVVFNHLWAGRMPGGYVGVDVFFVISGYLITQHLGRELNSSGSIRLGAFYARRAKRLLPASLLVATVSLVGAWLFLPFSRWAVIVQETFASVLYFENWALAAKSIDYSAHNDAASTVQHFWSLSVEEQFYLFWPLLLLGLFALAGKLQLHTRRIIISGLALVSLLALIFCIYCTFTNRSQAYFVTPARVWEFGAGALVGLMVAGDSSGPLRARSLALRGIGQWVGFALIAYAALTFDETTYFPGYAALVPVTGTILVIASGPFSPRWSPNGFLAARPVQYIGDISYSLYLWHWPLIILSPALLDRTLTTVDRGGILLAALLLAAATKKFVEDPGRVKLLPNSPVRSTFIAMAGAMAVCVALCGALLIATQAAQQKADRQLENIASGRCYGAGSLTAGADCPDPYGPPEVANVGPSEAPWFDTPECSPAPDPIVVKDMKLLRDCDFAAPGKATATVWLAGDSHAEQWKVAVYELARKHKWRIRESLMGGCPLVDVDRVAFMDVENRDPNNQQRCRQWANAVSDRIRQERPQYVFLSSFAAKETIDDGTGRSQLDQYRDAVNDRVKAWTGAGSNVFVLRDTPLTLRKSPAECLQMNRDTPLACANPKQEALPPDPLAEAAKSMKSAQVHVLDLSDQFCDDTRCYAAIGGSHVFFDADHASRSYIKSVTPVLEHRFNQVNPS
ncbi:peptidoglycan/LPS O-acetylase OafA/YrhL [Arthrobacter sp. PvP023]|uniref:acyltransferase family protein n=1 Tax=Micrococcaceae TaxID=1268 RepID=UPI001B405F58|nr:acyltransferase family protein [Arthrobacter sp. PvP023]MBP1135642.1 peptidoglycan/LPS O-acetylase OafA/YrhL [Arthrobacter sp. PvP023]